MECGEELLGLLVYLTLRLRLCRCPEQVLYPVRRPALERPRHNIFEHRLVIEDLGVLKGAPDASPSHARGRHRLKLESVDHNSPGRQWNKPGNTIDKRCLAGTIRPDQA